MLKQHEIRAVPVVDRANRVVGIVTVSDFLTHANAIGEGDAKQRLQRLITRTDGLTSNKPEVAGQIMTTPVQTVQPGDKLTVVIDLLHKHDIHHVPVVDKSNKLVGIISSTDLVYVPEVSQ